MKMNLSEAKMTVTSISFPSFSFSVMAAVRHSDAAVPGPDQV
jgi:hypothetical protein